MDIYHRTGQRLIGFGFCGPDKAVDVPADEARKMATWPDWSLTPFTKTETEAADKPSEKITEAVSDAE